MRRSNWTALAVCILVLGLTAAAPAGFPGDQPYQRSYETHPAKPNTARLIRPARKHPDAGVSRTLSAQPVHPWMAEVVIGSQTTHIDPLRDLRKDSRGIDHNHSLVRAQRLYRQLEGVTTTELNRVRNASRAATDRPAKANRAQVVHGERRERQRVVRIHVIPRPQEQTEPKPAGEPQPERTPQQQDAPRKIAVGGGR